jgi:hypothetical protein
MQQAAKVNDLEKLRSSFYLFVFGGVAGVIPRREGWDATKCVPGERHLPFFIL